MRVWVMTWFFGTRNCLPSVVTSTLERAQKHAADTLERLPEQDDETQFEAWCECYEVDGGPVVVEVWRGALDETGESDALAWERY